MWDLQGLFLIAFIVTKVENPFNMVVLIIQNYQIYP